MQYRQGDVLLVRVDKLPQDLQGIERDGEKFVLAYGEATGHAHTVDQAEAKFWRKGEDRFIEISEAAELHHQEHAAVPLEPGFYKVIRQREYDPKGDHLVGD